MKTSVVVGNPKPASRTLQTACALAEALCGQPADHVIDVITLGPGLLGWGDPGVSRAVEEVSSSDLAVFASPTFKATYTGVLKLFLDQFATGSGLRGVVAIPLMLGAGPGHSMAPEYLLKPVLVELGATVPVQGLYVPERSYDDPDAWEPWAERWSGAVTPLLRR